MLFRCCSCVVSVLFLGLFLWLFLCCSYVGLMSVYVVPKLFQSFDCVLFLSCSYGVVVLLLCVVSCVVLPRLYLRFSYVVRVVLVLFRCRVCVVLMLFLCCSFVFSRVVPIFVLRCSCGVPMLL